MTILDPAVIETLKGSAVGDRIKVELFDPSKKSVYTRSLNSDELMEYNTEQSKQN